MCSKEQTAVTSDDVKEYYGKTLSDTVGVSATDACSWDQSRMPPHFKRALTLVHPDVKLKHYGCGLVAPEMLEGTSVLDLGSGAGQDVFVLSNLVQEHGHVTGIDMTDEMLAICENYIDYHTEKYNYKSSNVNFVKGFIEDLAQAGIKDKTYDAVVSNCVVCLSTNKRAVLSEIYRVLKDGGELYFSDMYADRPVSSDLSKDKVLWGEGLSGSLYWKDFMEIAKEVGFGRAYIVSSRKLTISNENVRKLVGDTQYAAVTYRLFKVPPNCDDCDYNATYSGNAPNYPDAINFCKTTQFKTGAATQVDGYLANILKTSRFNEVFNLEKMASVKETVDKEEDPFMVAGCPQVHKGCNST